MNRNVGGYDRIGRLAIGAILLAVAVAGYAGLVTLAVGPLPQALAAVVVAVVGIILLATGAVQFCPINRALGIDTCSRA